MSRTHLEWENLGWLVVERVVCGERPQVHSYHENSGVRLLVGSKQ